MTTEDDFQAALDANPDDHLTRLVFADWLQDRDDPRAEGYRALGTLRLRGNFKSADWFYRECGNYGHRDYDGHRAHLATDWYWNAVSLIHREVRGDNDRADCMTGGTRRETEDVIALGFARLDPVRRRELLATVPA